MLLVLCELIIDDNSTKKFRYRFQSVTERLKEKNKPIKQIITIDLVYNTFSRLSIINLKEVLKVIKNLKELRGDFKNQGVFYTPPELARYIKSFFPDDIDEIYDTTWRFMILNTRYIYKK